MTDREVLLNVLCRWCGGDIVERREVPNYDAYHLVCGKGHASHIDGVEIVERQAATARAG